MNPKIEVGIALPSDVRGMAECHHACFTGRFMVEMGMGWLAGLYRYYIEHPGGVSVVARDDSGVVGLAVGGEPQIRQEFLHGALRRYPHLLLWKLLTNKLVRRVLVGELLNRLRRQTQAQATDGGDPRRSGRCGNLLSICVLPRYRGVGAADRLLEQFQKECASRGFDSLRLSVLAENERAVGFYVRQGWSHTGQVGPSKKFSISL